MIKLFRISSITFLAAVLILIISQATSSQPRNNSATTKSPNGRFAVRFLDERSGSGNAGKLWGRVTVRDLQSGIERTVRVAQGQRGRGIFEGFSLYEQSAAWSPDGLYLAYWDDQCQDEPAVPGGAICHLHEICFLSMQRTLGCREELVLSRYAFGGWARGQSHTILEILINEDGQTVPRSPCYDRAQKGFARVGGS
jgi:hypothetical protein